MTQKNEFLSGETARKFDFDRIREEIASLAVSEEGKQEVLERESSFDREKVEHLKDLGFQWHLYLNSQRPQAILNFPPVKYYFSILGIEGSALLQEQIFGLGLFAMYSQKARDLIISASQEIKIPDLWEEAEKIPSLETAANKIFSVIDINGEIKDLPSIRAIKNRIAQLHREIENALRKYTSDASMQSALQSNVPAFRADRELLAIRADHKNSVKGIVHEASASGQTLYIEPEEVVKANNQLVEEEYNLQAELNKIFRELTAELSEYKEEFKTAHAQMVLLDSTLAAARYMHQINGVFAQAIDLSQEPPKLISARHPLLKESAVPVTINFMHGKNVLIITGPNTGGKTVTLKTFALFSLLNQAGFPIPCAEGTKLPYFNAIFADIGDEQSIDQSLSTFSSRMKKAALALNNADSNSLVLLDEFGSGTDPLEGSAIAMATLDLLLEKNAFVITTTHHGVLKNYGYTNPKCINASVEFDSQTLHPTYRLMMGVPGESHAIEIALNSGLPQRAVEIAKTYISTQQADVSTLIQGLTQKHEELDSLIREHNIMNAELTTKELKLHSRENRLLERDIELKERENSKGGEFLRETRSRLENLVRVLREGELTKVKTQGVKQFISDLEQEIEDNKKALEQQKEELEKQQKLLEAEEEQVAENGIRIKKSKDRGLSSTKKTRHHMSNKEALASATVDSYQTEFSENMKNRKNKGNVKPAKIEYTEGMEVLAGSDRRQGVLVRKEADGLWLVQFGSVKLKVSQRQLVPLKIDPNIKKTASYIFEKSDENSDDVPKFELRLLGMRHEEAMRALEHQLDLCAINGLKSFSIIHGKGNGILQQGVQDYLNHYPGLKDHHFARPEDGGSGKTYVELF